MIHSGGGMHDLMLILLLGIMLFINGTWRRVTSRDKLDFSICILSLVTPDRYSSSISLDYIYIYINILNIHIYRFFFFSLLGSGSCSGYGSGHQRQRPGGNAAFTDSHAWPLSTAGSCIACRLRSATAVWQSVWFSDYRSSHSLRKDGYGSFAPDLALPYGASLWFIKPENV